MEDMKMFGRIVIISDYNCYQPFYPAIDKIAIKIGGKNQNF